MTPQEQALGELKAIGMGAIDADAVADFLASSSADQDRIVAKWKLIADVRSPALFAQVGDILGRIADFAPIAGKIIAIATVL